MGTAGLHAALRRGEPLADVDVVFRPGVDGAAATALINSIADDFDLHPSPHYGDPRLRIGTATRDALDRLFGWKLRRTRFPDGPDGPTVYYWEEVTPVTHYPPGLQEVIESMGLDQPGADDDGQWYDYP